LLWKKRISQNKVKEEKHEYSIPERKQRMGRCSPGGGQAPDMGKLKDLYKNFAGNF
jgi:hypothetical protein